MDQLALSLDLEDTFSLSSQPMSFPPSASSSTASSGYGPYTPVSGGSTPQSSRVSSFDFDFEAPPTSQYDTTPPSTALATGCFPVETKLEGLELPTHQAQHLPQHLPEHLSHGLPLTPSGRHDMAELDTTNNDMAMLGFSIHLGHGPAAHQPLDIFGFNVSSNSPYANHPTPTTPPIQAGSRPDASSIWNCNPESPIVFFDGNGHGSIVGEHGGAPGSASSSGSRSSATSTLVSLGQHPGGKLETPSTATGSSPLGDVIGMSGSCLSSPARRKLFVGSAQQKVSTRQHTQYSPHHGQLPSSSPTPIPPNGARRRVKGEQQPRRRASMRKEDSQITSGEEYDIYEEDIGNRVLLTGDFSVVEKRRFNCTEPGCIAKFKRREHWQRHHTGRHTANPPNPTCVCCNKTFTNRYDNLVSHLRLHANPEREGDMSRRVKFHPKAAEALRLEESRMRSSKNRAKASARARSHSSSIDEGRGLMNRASSAAMMAQLQPQHQGLGY